MPQARIEFEFVDKRWVIQIEVSNYMTAKRITLYAGDVVDAFRDALERYQIIAAAVDKQIERPAVVHDLTDAASELVGAPLDSNGELLVHDIAGVQFAPGETLAAISKGMENITGVTPDILETQLPPKPRRGRHPKTCTCGKCEARRAA